MRLLRILPGVFIMCSVVVCTMPLCQGSSTSQEITDLLQRRSPVEIWLETRISFAQEPAVSRMNPLVIQAQIYAKLLNPPEPPRADIKDTRVFTKSMTALPQPVLQATPQKASPNFKVHATSVFANNPKKSMALIAEPGKGVFWIRPGDTLGHLKIIEIRHHAVVYVFKDSVGEVAWEPSGESMLSREKSSAPALAINMTHASAAQTSLPSIPESPLPSSFAESQNNQMHNLYPRPKRGGR